MRPSLLTLIVLLSKLPLLYAQEAWTPDMMPDVQTADRNAYVSDPGGLLSPQTVTQVNAMLAQVRAKTTCEVFVAIPPSIGDESVEEWSLDLFARLGIGKSDRDNGVLLVISPESRKARIETGYGIEGVLPDIACSNIIQRYIIPEMREGNLDGAVTGAVRAISGALEDPAVAEELRSAQPDKAAGLNALDKEVILDFMWGVIGILLMVSLFVFLHTWRKARRCGDNYQKAEMWRKSVKEFMVLTIFTAGIGLVFLLGAILFYRWQRTRKRTCSRCGHKMHRLSEEEDNFYLTPSEDFEEKIKTVDYDVWKCPQCNLTERFPFRAEQKKYTECPKCHTVAMCMVEDITLSHPTTRQEGTGQKIYECKYCHNRNNKYYRIPKKEDAAAALAAGAILGSTLGRGGGGGGNFGGGFGGGSSGGGGASGSW